MNANLSFFPRALALALACGAWGSACAGDFPQRLVALGFDAGGMTPRETTAFIAAETEKWGKLIREAGIKGE